MVWLVTMFILAGAWIAVSAFVVGVNQRRLNYGMAGLAALWTVVNSVTVVQAGHVGVKDLFGSVSDDILHPGLRIVSPLLRIHQMSVRTQELKETAAVPSSEGLIVTLEVSLLFNLEPAKAPDVYRTLGTSYRDVFVEPQLRSHVRGATASFEAKALYTTAREVIADRILGELNPIYEARGFSNAQMLLRNVELPNVVANAIQQKLKAEQEAEQMRFVLQREEQEAERKRIEARGIADFQRIVTTGISEPLLRWKGIEATEHLATSQNAKVVIVGGQNGLPLILNTP
ncbi:MAG: prohibitin family protein [Gemmatimonadota bacterium]